MTDIIPGDTLRISVVGNDSTLLVDGWTSTIRGNTVGYDGTVLVDTSNNTLAGTLIGSVQGTIKAANGHTVFNAGVDGQDAVFIGDVVGDLTGTVFGDVTGSLTGDLIADDGSILIDATTKTLTVDSININDNISVNSLSSASIITGIITGHLQGDVTGDITGTLNGDHYGMHYGSVEGILKGNVYNSLNQIVLDTTIDTPMYYGDVSGNLYGTLEGDFFGNTQGTHTGLVIGNVQGDLTGSILSGNGSVAISTSNDSVLIGKNSNEVIVGDNNNYVRNVNYFNNQTTYIKITNPLNSNLVSYSRRSDAYGNDAALIGGDVLNSNAVFGYDGTKDKLAGLWGFVIDPDYTVNPNDPGIEVSWGIDVGGANKIPNARTDTALKLNSKGELYSKRFQVGIHTSTERNAIVPQKGMIIFNDSTNKFQGYNGENWVDLS